MIICPNCGRENADHYKFCLGCGTELSKSRSAPAAPTVIPVPRAAARPVLRGAEAAPAARVNKPIPVSAKPLARGTPARGMPPQGAKRELATVRDYDPEFAAGADSGWPSASVEARLGDLGPDESHEDSENADFGTADFFGGAPGGEDESELPNTGEPAAAPAEPLDGDDGGDGAGRDEGAASADAEALGKTSALDVVDLPEDDPAPTPMQTLGDPTEQARRDAGGEPESTDPGAQTPAPQLAATPAPIKQPRGATAGRSGPSPNAVAPASGPRPVVETARPRAAFTDTTSESPIVSDPRKGPVARICTTCNAIVPDGFKFCGVCGARYEEPAPAPAMPHVVAASVGHSPARLVLIHPDGTEGERFALNAGETVIGRDHPTPLFADDVFLSPGHATFYFVKGQLFVRDEGSLNGVFLRIKAEVELFHGDMFRIGQQLMRFEEMAQVRPVMPGAGDGTIVMGSPVRGAWALLSSVVAIQTHASVWALRKPEEFLGRERGDILFPEDGFVSGVHAKVANRDGRSFLQDLDSTNGTYLRIKGEGILARGDLLLLGQQLFKVELERG